MWVVVCAAYFALVSAFVFACKGFITINCGTIISPSYGMGIAEVPVCAWCLMFIPVEWPAHLLLSFTLPPCCFTGLSHPMEKPVPWNDTEPLLYSIAPTVGGWV